MSPSKTNPSGSKKKTGRPFKKISSREKKFADLIIDSGLGAIQAARQAFGWKCEPGTKQARDAIELRRSTRVKNYILSREEKEVRELEVNQIFENSDSTNWDRLRRFCYTLLRGIRDDPNKPARHRYNAAMALEKLSDPNADTNLIMRWVDIVWRGARAHCPCCHETFPLWKIQNRALDDWRNDEEINPPSSPPSDLLNLRMEVLKLCDRGHSPHKSQIPALQAEERHIVALAPARAGKSYLLAGFSVLQWLMPGAEIWILAQSYQSARSEVEYFKRFLATLFYPNYKNVVASEQEDARSGELVIRSRWGSELRVMSARSKGSIIGRELDLALVAEPGWVDETVLNHLRARMVSRLGRILMFGTPQGFQGILGRFINMTGRDQKGKIVRVSPEDRTLDRGCKWNLSLLKYQMDPRDNPAYVQSELEAARMELTDAEYASEFEGLMASAEGSMFPHLTPRHMGKVPYTVYQNSVFVLGIDQGPKNFAACLLAYDNQRVICAKEYFEGTPRTMKSNMIKLYHTVPSWLKFMGCDPSQWVMTIYDAAPLIHNELAEMEDEGMPWPSDVTFRPQERIALSWRPDTYEYINAMSAGTPPNLLFDLECDLLHDQLMRAQQKEIKREKDSRPDANKGWIITDPWRGDHVCDAFAMAMYTIASGMVLKPDRLPGALDPWSEAQANFNYQFARSERDELSGFQEGSPDHELYEKHFGRKQAKHNPFDYSRFSPYKDY